MSRFIDVIACKAGSFPHKHATDRTVIYSVAGVSLGPRFEICPLKTLRAKDSMQHILNQRVPKRLVMEGHG